MVLSFAHTVGEFGVVLMVGGNLPGVTRTVSISIYDQVQTLQYREANRTALFLLAFSFAVLLVVYGLRRRPLAAAPHGMTLTARLAQASVRRGSPSTCRSGAEPGVTILFGASGSGKTTILRCVAGLTRPDAGRIAIGDRVLFDSRPGVDVPVPERRIGYVFQQLALFPHMTVAQNIGYGLRRCRAASGDSASADRRVVPHRRPARTAGRRRSPAASVSGRRWRARSSPIPKRCCSTSRCRRSTTRSSATSWTTSGAGTRRGASRCST